MMILGIETSCDETALAFLEASGNISRPRFETVATALLSQTKLHEKHGGVVPMLAKREHQKNLVPLLLKLIEDAGDKIAREKRDFPEDKIVQVKKIFAREPELLEIFLEKIPHVPRPNIDQIAVTYGPGLEPALWVGINFAQALSCIWNVPVVPVNHMEGHICSVLTKGTNSEITFPALALLISGGHTELVLAEKWGQYKILGKTRDDAVGEAFDKVARLLGLPYPGGPEISKLAEAERKSGKEKTITLPRPMIHSKDFDFSFAGLKTAVLYTIKKLPLNPPQGGSGEHFAEQNVLAKNIKSEIALEFEDAVTEVLISKTEKAIEKNAPKTLILGGGVTANKHIREAFEKLVGKFTLNADLKLFIPETSLSTDNAVMIAMAGYFSVLLGAKTPEEIKASGNLSL